jgi:hypothetical protein
LHFGVRRSTGLSSEKRDITGSTLEAWAIATHLCLHGARQRASLLAKESEPKKSQAKIKVFEDGLGHVLLDPEIIAHMEQEAKDENQGRLAREARKSAMEAKKDEEKAFKAQWNTLKVQRAKEVAEWEHECQILQGQGTAKKDLPKRSPPPRKARLQAQNRVESSSDEMANLFIVPGSLVDTVQDSNEDTMADVHTEDSEGE